MPADLKMDLRPSIMNALALFWGERGIKMIRRLTLLIAASAILSAPACFGLGLGELELKSALNQRFEAEVELTNVRGLEIEEILPNLGSQDDFDRVGVERGYALIDLRFKVASRENGKLFVRISSSRPIIEPFLNFIVEVLWPSGRILREYTVLLDPPVFGKDGVEPIQLGETEQRASPARQPTPAAPQSGRQEADLGGLSQSSQEGRISSGEYGITGPGDTLWKIALEVRPDRSVSVQQTMLALKAANPEAFINDNINLLKAGHVLRIPEANTIRSESLGSAVAEVRVQNEQFDAYKTGSVTQLDASRRQVQSDAGASTEDDGELKLLASSESSGDRAGSGSDARAQELQDDLAVAEEDLDRARRANTELNVRFEDLQGQLDTLNEILTLKDDQLAALRAEVQKMQASAGPAPAVTPTPQSAASGSLLTNPLVLTGLGLLLVGGVAAGLILVRRRQQSSAVDDDLEEEVEEEALQVELEEDAEAQIEVEDAAVAMDATIISTEPIEAIVDSDDLDLDAAEDDEISLDLEDDDDLELDLGDEDEDEAEDEAEDEDAISLDLDDDDDAISLDLDDDDDAISLDLDDDDDAISVDLDDDVISLDLDDDDDAISLNLDDDDDAISVDLDDDDDELSLDLDDDDVISLDLDDDGGNKLDLARAYIDMGDGDGARSVLEEVIKKGSESEIQEANELLEKIK